jgi:DNA polymerase III epsilon subunit
VKNKNDNQQQDDFIEQYVDQSIRRYAQPHQKRSKIVSIFTKKWFFQVENSYIVLDIETTGLANTYDKIIEIAAIKYINNIATDTFHTLVNPEDNIPKAASAVNGITNAMVKDAPTIQHVMPSFLSFIGNDTILVAHNANFDISFIEVWCDRLGFTNKQWNYIDTVSVAKKIIPGLSNYKQQTVLNAIKYAQSTYHRALDDCKGCAEIMVLAIESLHDIMHDKTLKQSDINEMIKKR